MRVSLIAAIAALALVLHANPASAQPPADTARVPTVTRLVKLFYGLETGLNESVHRHDAQAIESALDPSFEQRSGNAAGTPVARDAWIRQATSEAAAPSNIAEMAVHDFGSIALVSFRESVKPANGRPSERFVVDGWTRAGDEWKLAVRYVSDLPSSGKAGSAALNGNKKSAKDTVDKRY